MVRTSVHFSTDDLCNDNSNECTVHLIQKAVGLYLFSLSVNIRYNLLALGINDRNTEQMGLIKSHSDPC